MSTLCSCFSFSFTSNLEKSSWTLPRRLRHGLSARSRRVWPFSEKNQKRCTQESHEEEEDAMPCTIYPKEGARKGWRRLCCACGSEEDLDESCALRTDQQWAERKVAGRLVPAFLEGDLAYIQAFLATYRTYTTTQQALDLLFQWYGCNFPRSSGDGALQDQLKGAISFILFTWLAEHLEDFQQPPDFPCLKAIVEFLQANMPGSDLELRAHRLLEQFPRLEPAAAEPAAAKPRQVPQDPAAAPEPACGSPGDVEPASAPAQDLHRAPGPPSPVQSLTPGGQPAEELLILPGSAPEVKQEQPGDVDPDRETTSELQRALDPPSPAPSPGTGGESAAELESLPSPSLEVNPETPGDADPACETTSEFLGTADPPLPAASQGTGGESAAELESLDGPSLDVNQEPPGDADPACETTSEFLGTADPPLPAASRGTDGESALELDARPGPAQEANQEHLADVDLDPEKISVLHTAPAPPSQAPEANCHPHGDVDPDDETTAEPPATPDPPLLAPSPETGAESAGGLGAIPVPIPEENQGPSSDLEPAPLLTLGLHEALDAPSPDTAQAQEGEPCAAAPPPKLIVLHSEGASAPEADPVLPSPEREFS